TRTADHNYISGAESEYVVEIAHDIVESVFVAPEVGRKLEGRRELDEDLRRCSHVLSANHPNDKILATEFTCKIIRNGRVALQRHRSHIRRRIQPLHHADRGR